MTDRARRFGNIVRIRLPADAADRLRQIADDDGRTRSDLGRHLIVGAMRSRGWLEPVADATGSESPMNAGQR